jgi:hypothetical protein
MLITKLKNNALAGDLLETTDYSAKHRKMRNFFSMNTFSMSPVPETNTYFNNEEHYAYYEMGPKEDHLEYFL